MAIFKYRGLEKNGALKTGIITANDKSESLTHLINNGISVTSLRRTFVIFNRINNKELIQFFTHFLFQIRCRVSVPDAVLNYSEISDNTEMKAVLDAILQKINGGEGLYEAFNTEKKVFGNIIPSLLQSAESSGLLENSLESILTYLKFNEQIRHKIRKAMSYPIFIFFIAISTFAFSITYLAPQVQEFVEDQPSFLSKLCFAMIPEDGGLIAMFEYLLLVIFAIFVIPKHKLLEISLHIPVIEKVIRKIYEWNCCTTLYISFKSKMDMIQSLQLLIASMTNSPFQAEFKKLLDDVVNGMKFTDALAETQVISPDIVPALKIGEESNELVNTLRNIIESQDHEIGRMISRLGISISISITVITGMLLIIILLGLFYPLYDCIDIMKL